MPTSNYFKYYQFNEDVCYGAHNLANGGDVLKFGLSLADAPTATHANTGAITDRVLTPDFAEGNTLVQAAGTGLNGAAFELRMTEPAVFTASTPIANFQYLFVYNSSNTTLYPGHFPLICWYDYASVVAIGAGETLTIDFLATNNVMFDLT